MHMRGDGAGKSAPRRETGVKVRLRATEKLLQRTCCDARLPFNSPQNGLR